jgi:hypothetical protein
MKGLPSHLKTIYVQHDDMTEDNGVSLIDELLSSKTIVEAKCQRETALAALRGIFFTGQLVS